MDDPALRRLPVGESPFRDSRPACQCIQSSKWCWSAFRKCGTWSYGSLSVSETEAHAELSRKSIRSSLPNPEFVENADSLVCRKPLESNRSECARGSGMLSGVCSAPSYGMAAAEMAL